MTSTSPQDLASHSAESKVITTTDEENDELYLLNKKVPAILREDVAEVLSYFPELAETEIEFVLRNKINKSFMQAQPKWYGFFQSSKKRDYVIKISRHFQLEDSSIPLEEIPREVRLGWLAHELGHIMDYQERNAFSLMGFGISYITSRKSMMEAERAADVHAIHCNTGDLILHTKDFILNYEGVPQVYRNKIEKYYMSAEDAMQIIEEIPQEVLSSEE
ncbi:MAG: hypothetical protein ACLFQ0_00470 [Cyclobacteriaceae bacterium]